jgi:hypothetical protein
MFKKYVKENKMSNIRTTCNANRYCEINRTKLIDRGIGKSKICPVCDTIYDVEPPKVQKSANYDPDEALRRMRKLFGPQTF